MLFGHLEKNEMEKGLHLGSFKCIRQDINLILLIHSVIISFSSHDEHLRRALVTHML